MDTQHTDFTWFTSRVEATSTGIGFYIIAWESKHSSATTSYAARDLLGNFAHTTWSPSLLDLFSSIMLSSYNISSLSLSQSLWIVTFILKELTTGYSKIIQTE